MELLKDLCCPALVSLDVRYSRLFVFRALCVRHATLKVDLSASGSHLSALSVGVMCSWRSAPVRSLAAAWKVALIGASKHLGVPVTVALRSLVWRGLGIEQQFSCPLEG